MNVRVAFSLNTLNIPKLKSFYSQFNEKKKSLLAHQSAEMGFMTPYVRILIITKNNQVYCVGPLEAKWWRVRDELSTGWSKRLLNKKK